MWFSLAMAADIVVPTQAPTLADAVAMAVDGDTIVLQAGTYTEALQIEDLDIEVAGLGVVELVVPALSEPHSINSATVTLRNLRLDGAHQGHTLGITNANVLLHNVLITGGLGTTGGGVDAQVSELRIWGGSFETNEASSGGHLHTSGGSLWVEGTTFSFGTATGASGGALHLEDTQTTIRGALFTENTVDGTNEPEAYGGAIAAEEGTLVIEGSTFLGNTCAHPSICYGGAIRTADGIVELYRSRFEANHASFGAAVNLFQVMGEASGNHFVGQTVPPGETQGVLRSFGGALNIQDNHFEANHTARGGAIFLNGGTHTVRGNLLCGNTADANGGGLYGFATTLALQNNIFLSNQASIGAGVYINSSTLQVDNNHFVNNTGNRLAALGLLWNTTLPMVESRSNLYANNASVQDPNIGETDLVFAGLGLRSSYDLFFGQTGPDYWPNAVVSAPVPNDPMLTLNSCDLAGLSTAGSVAVGAGHPSLPDAGSTIATIGAWGGPFHGARFDDNDSDGVVGAQDCDDGNNAVGPQFPELCDGIDNDCDQLVDRLDPNVFGALQGYLDDDHDGFGDPNRPRVFCLADDGFVMDAGDCDDQDATRYPGATEIEADGIDQDCDGDDLIIDRDADGDGLLDRIELGLGTDPNSIDTDQDGLDDATEVGNPEHPADHDGDGLIDALDDDDDGDGLPTSEETDADIDGDGVGNHLDTDSDGDGAYDGVDGAPYEVRATPPIPNDATPDYGCGCAHQSPPAISGGLLLLLLLQRRRGRLS